MGKNKRTAKKLPINSEHSASPVPANPLLKLVDTEEVLRRAICGVLQRIPDISDIDHTHGRNELGKDIVFARSGPLGELEYCACVVILGKITGTVESNSSVRKIYEQVETALDTPFLNKEATQTKVSKAYVMTPHAISQDALKHIEGKLAQRSGQVIFFCGDMLIGLFQKYWPDFLADESSALKRYLDALEESQDSERAIARLAEMYNYRGASSLTKRIYISLELQRKRYSFNTNPGDAVLKELTDICRKPKYLTKDIITTCAPQIKKVIDFFLRCERWQAVESWPPSATPVLISTTGTELYSFLQRLVPVTGNTVVCEGEAAQQLHRLCQEFITPCKLSLTAACAALPPSAHAIEIDKLLSDSTVVATWRREDCLASSEGGVLTVNHLKPVSVANHQTISKGSYVVTGPPGSGKTTYCRWNALEDARKYRNGTSQIIPIYVGLHNLPIRKNDFVGTFIRGPVAISSLLTWNIADIDKVSLRLYLDGFDELGSDEKRYTVGELLRDGLSRWSNIQAVLTSREYAYTDAIGWLPRLSLAPLTPDQVDELAHQWYADDEELYKSFCADIRREQAKVIASLASTPLLATLILLAYRTKRTLPHKRADLYANVVDLLYQGWDLAKGIMRPRKYGHEMKEALLCAVAFYLQRQRTRVFSLRTFQKLFVNLFPKLKTNATDVITELLVDGLFTRTEDGYVFVHLTFQEYFAAKVLHEDPNHSDFRDAVDSYLSYQDDNWTEVLKFYFEMHQNPMKMLDWVRNVLMPSSGEEMARFSALRRHCDALLPG